MPHVVRNEIAREIAFPVERVWPILAKTDWINRSLGLPSVQYEMSPESNGGILVKARASYFGLPLRWKEWPFEWVENDYYSVRRSFDHGPIDDARFSVQLTSHSATTVSVTARSEIRPRNWAALLLVRYGLGPLVTRRMGKLLQHVEQFIAGQQPVPLPNLSREPVAEPALQVALDRLRKSRQPPELILQLEKLVKESPDAVVARLRPLAIAKQWGKPGWDIVRLFFEATRAGLLDLSWEVLCPNCRSTPVPPSQTLADVQSKSHCEACQIRYDAEFDRSVELQFTVNASIRAQRNERYCLAGPGGKPHIVSQLFLAPNESRSWKLPNATGSLRLRSPQVEHPWMLSSEELRRFTSSSLICEPRAFRVEPQPASAGAGTPRPGVVVNSMPYPVFLVLEHLAWSEEILTAARVTNCQDFRDLFAREVISPLERITVGQQVILFTDLRGSTALYNGIGDAPAYVLVREHFNLLFDVVRRNHGAVVKTIGDAVMAVFSRVDEALAAVLEMHRKLSAVPYEALGGKPLHLKSSLHLGPCLAVNANDRLDYFGTTVNLAARMISCCQGGDLTVSRDLFEHPETRAFLHSLDIKSEPSEVILRGFDIPRQVWRLPLL